MILLSNKTHYQCLTSLIVSSIFCCHNSYFRKSCPVSLLIVMPCHFFVIVIAFVSVFSSQVSRVTHWGCFLLSLSFFVVRSCLTIHYLKCYYGLGLLIGGVLKISSSIGKKVKMLGLCDQAGLINWPQIPRCFTAIGFHLSSFSWGISYTQIYGSVYNFYF